MKYSFFKPSNSRDVEAMQRSPQYTFCPPPSAQMIRLEFLRCISAFRFMVELILTLQVAAGGALRSSIGHALRCLAHSAC